MSQRLEIAVHRKEYQTDDSVIPALGRIMLDVEAGEFVSLMGPSGCGKTTLLRLILGLDDDFVGHIRLGSSELHGPGLDRGMVFQDPRLLPWLTIEQNVALAIDAGADLPGSNYRVRDLLKLTGLDGFESAWPRQLSGGMAQRAALARALVNVPDILLMDEPFGSLDSHTRVRMQRELRQILENEGTTTLMVTHDVDEAIYLSDRVVLLSARPGTVQSVFAVDIEPSRKRLNPDFIALRTRILEAFYG